MVSVCSVCGMEVMAVKNLMSSKSGYCFGCGRVVEVNE